MNKQRIFLFLRRSAAISALSAALLVFGLAFSSDAQSKPAVIPIAEATKLALGSELAIEGTVTVASGAFRSSFDDYGFQVQDKTGGMYITIKTDPHLAVGQKVRVTGKRSQTALKFQIVETDEKGVQVLSGTARPKPFAIATGKIAENTIGKLIKISATVSDLVVEIAPYGFRVPVNDGTGEIVAYISTSTGISTKEIVPGQKLELIGIAGKFNDHFQIYPRSPADVKLIGKPDAAK